MRARADRGRSDGYTLARFPFYPLQVKGRADWMAPLSHHRTAAGEFPNPVVGRVRPTMGLLAQNAKYLCTALLHDLPFLLDDRCIHPIFRVADQLAAGLGRCQNAGATCRSL